MTTVVEKVTHLLEAPLQNMGYEIVRVLMIGGKHQTLQIMADRIDETEFTVNDCEKISHTASALLDVEDIIQERYNLEISSPGLDRPLIKQKDFARFKDHVARIDMRTPQGIDGRKKFQGKLSGVDGEMINIACDDEDFSLPFADIAKAQLVITEEVFRNSLKKGKKGN